MDQLNGSAEWTILSPPIIFGETAKLALVAKNESEKSTRIWQGGQQYVQLCRNGISLNPKKYRESTIRFPFESILEIKTFSEDDVDCDYSCSIGFIKDRHRLSLNEKDFEWHPNADSIAVASTLRKGFLIVDAVLIKVYPKPVCRISFEGMDLNESTATNVIEKNGKLFRVKITLEHAFKSEICKGELKITCQIGQTDMQVYLKEFNSCQDNHGNQPVTKQSDNSAHHNYITLILISAIAIVGITTVVAFVVLVKYRKCRDNICCVACLSGESRDNTTLRSSLLTDI